MAKDILLITGANGLVAKRFYELFNDLYTIRFLTRKKVKSNEYEWDINKKYIDKEALKNVDHIIHLAGAGIADKKWTAQRRDTIMSSRTDSAVLIFNTLKDNNLTVKTFVSASAIGYYGAITSTDIFTENSSKGHDFLSDVCYKWEEAASHFEEHNLSQRTLILRIGVVLSSKGGALKQMLLPIKYGLGAAIGKGNQYMPWIHIDDLCFMLNYVIDNNSVKGIYNAVSPEHLTNKTLTTSLANRLNKPLFLPHIPSFIIRLLFGKRSVLLLEGSRVSAEKILAKGFRFRYKNIKMALENVLA